ncbi:MAG: carboxylating nicotinate-nucleotide diphosphorylase [Bacteriovoracaceae bacterium]|jgi:nicotinate-nucleotide pyrophosphorylase (carboxylating)|nr:carboxylating nicotinate-nucleotide diphosphorylase [Bacteriovoracaceae bacterium]
MKNLSLRQVVNKFFEEDDFSRNIFYNQSLPTRNVKCQLKLKDDLILSGLPFVESVFSELIGENFSIVDASDWEGRKISKSENEMIEFELPFNVALSGERLALNLLQRSSSVSTYTNKFVKIAEASGIKILDTRKTTPGLRFLEKYAVRVGGGYNHRMGQTDTWMIKDNHKSFFGSLKDALEFFNKMGSFYNSIVVEIHNTSELEEAISLGVKHVMLDNFSPEQVSEAISLKRDSMTFEVSGGINLENIKNYLISGVDGISIGKITYDAPSVDISLKFG